MEFPAIAAAIFGAIALGALIAGLVWWLRRLDQPRRDNPEVAPKSAGEEKAQGISAAFKKEENG